MLGRLSFWGPAYFQGRTVKLPGSSCSVSWAYEYIHFFSDFLDGMFPMYPKGGFLIEKFSWFFGANFNVPKYHNE